MKSYVYLSGPMRGYIDDNYPAFHAYASAFRKRGFNVVNPAENFDGVKDLPMELYMRKDLAQVASCDIIAMLPGWKESAGAKAELFVAQTCELTAICADTGEDIPHILSINVEPKL